MESSPKRKFSGRISRGHPGPIRVDAPGQTLGQALETPELGYRRPFTGVKKASPWETPKKSLKRGSRGLSALGSKKARKRVKNDHFSSFLRVFGSFSTRFRLFFEHLDPGAERPRQPLQTFFWSFPRRGLPDPCSWPTIPLETLDKQGFGCRHP